jgi:ABC-type phosphate transport system substrate-binding protein
MKINKLLIAAFVLLLSINVSAQVAVIANKSVPDNSIDVSKLTDMYELKVKTWSDGKSIVPFILKSNEDINDKFFDAIGSSFMSMKKKWMKLQLTGEGRAPEACSSEDEILSKVGSTPGAIGYVSASKVNDNVKVLFTIK